MELIGDLWLVTPRYSFSNACPYLAVIVAGVGYSTIQITEFLLLHRFYRFSAGYSNWQIDTDKPLSDVTKTGEDLDKTSAACGQLC